MARLYKRPNSPYWWASFMRDGRLHRFSTGKTRRGDASLELSRKLADAHNETSVDRLVSQLVQAIATLPAARQRQFRQSVARLMVADNAARMSLDDAWSAWTSSPGRSPAETTQAVYEAIWRRFKAWAARQSPPKTYLDEFGAAAAETYAADLLAAHLSPRTYNAHLSFLASIFHTLRNRAGLAENIWRDIPRAQGAPRGRRELTPQELVTIITRAPQDLQTLFLIGAYTGMRLGDACTLKWESVVFDQGVIDYEPRKTARKGKRIRVPLSRYLAAWLRKLEQQPQTSAYVLPDLASAYHADRSQVSKRIQAHFTTTCGIATTEAKDGKQKRARAACRVGFHSLRHSFVSLCAANRVPQVAVMEMVGHGSPAMTRLYSHAGDEQKKDAIDRLPALLPPD